MNRDPIELAGLQVTLDQLDYQRLTPEQSPGKPHSFVYHISIHNDSEVSVTIRGRKWVVSHDDGTQLTLEGDGVVGETPTIAPGEQFRYNSRHVIGTRTAVAAGAYLGVDEHGRRVFVRIPPFELSVPAGE